jgi:hypothetical protein
MDSGCQRVKGRNNVQAYRHRYVVPISLMVMVCMVPTWALAQVSPSRHLTLVRPDAQEFDTLLNTNFPGIARLDGYATFRPYLVLLQNDTSLPVRAYMVTWETRLPTGATRRTANLVERYDPSPTSMRVALAPGQLRLVTPVFDVSPQEYQSNPHLHSWVAALMSAQQTHAPYSLTNTSITSSVDAAIFGDGLCVGEDHYQVFTRFERELAAEHDLAETILQLLDAKVPETGIVTFLKNEVEANTNASVSQGGSASMYAFHRARHAQNLLTLYRQGGLENVMAQSWKVTQQPQQQLSRALP